MIYGHIKHVMNVFIGNYGYGYTESVTKFICVFIIELTSFGLWYKSYSRVSHIEEIILTYPNFKKVSTSCTKYFNKENVLFYSYSS